MLENERYKIWWDFFIQTVKIIEHRRPYFVCIDKIAKICLIINIVTPGDQNIIDKEQEKIDKYQDLRRELGKPWKLKTEVVPVVVGTLGNISPKFKFYLKKIDISIVKLCLQNTAILGTAFILRRVHGISEFK